MNKTVKKISRFAAIGLISTSTLLPISSVWAEETTQPTAVTTVATDATTQSSPTPPPLPATEEKVHNPYGTSSFQNYFNKAKSNAMVLKLNVTFGKQIR